MKTTILFLLPLLVGAAIQAFDLGDMGTHTARTPYDRYFGSVRQVLAESSGHAATLPEVQQLQLEDRDFRYDFSTPYVPQTPATTGQMRSGDCKAKSLWLAAQLHDRRVRFVVGKLREGTPRNHMWLLWNETGTWWILDPTNQAGPKLASKVGEREYIALYSYTRSGALVHTAAAHYASDLKTLATVPTPAIATAKPRAPRAVLPARLPRQT